MSNKAINSCWMFDPPKAGYHYTFPPEPCRIVKILNPPHQQVQHRGRREVWRSPEHSYVVDCGGSRMYANDESLLPLDSINKLSERVAPSEGQA